MVAQRVRDFRLDLAGLAVLVPLLLVPFLVRSPLYLSLTHQTVVGIIAAMGVYIMLRMNLLPFTVPAFMAIGGYAAAMLSVWGGMTNLLVLMTASFVIPMLVAVPLGILVLRLKGTYFIFFTFILNEILQVAIFETPSLTGGSDGIAGVPPATLLGIEFGTPSLLLLVTIISGLVAGLVTLVVTHVYRAEFASIEENETLAESLGLAVWWYRSIGFVFSAGVSGLAGFAMVHMLTAAHPSSFASFSAINYVAYAFVGGRGTLLGPIVGAAVLVILSNLFSSQGLYSAALFGLLLMVVVMAAPGGLVGEIRRLVSWRPTGGRLQPLTQERARGKHG